MRMGATLKTVKAARKDQGKCANCQVPLPVGCSYRYYRPGFRSRAKVRVCMKPECTPKRSALEYGRMAEVLEAQESALAEIEGAESIEEVQSAIDTAAEAARDLSSDFEDTITEHPMLEETLRPQQEVLDPWVDELETVSFDEPEEDATEEEIADLLQAAKDAARDALDSLEW